MDDPSIPCEICQQVVPYSGYINHLEICQNRTSILNILDPIFNTFIQNQMTPMQIDMGLDSYVYHSDNSRTFHLEDFLDTFEMSNMISNIIDTVNNGCNDIHAAITTISPSNLCHSNICCSICLESLDQLQSDINISKTSCDHYFCEPCITRWLRDNKTCPLCKNDFNDVW